jgi:hypothetical protein
MSAKVSEARERALRKLPKHLREKILEDRSLLLKEKENREKLYPLKNFVPNIAQIRGMLCYSEPHETYSGRYPFIKVFRGGNGVGKTCTMCVLLAGVAYGNRFLNNEYFNHAYFDECEEIRKKRTLYIRIICKKADIEDTGSVYQQIKKWIPVAQFKDKSGGYYGKIHFPAPSPEFKDVVVDIKTFDMDVVSFAGPDFDLIVYNEPPPQDVYGENVGRLRLGGRQAFFLTPVDQAAWLCNLEKGDYPDGELSVTVAEIWDNCADIPGTNGILSRDAIMRMIRQWMASNPLEVPAREKGEYMHLIGSVYTVFREHVHVVDPFPIPKNYNVYKITDPHDVKPPFVMWVAASPTGFCYIFAEYPYDPWENIHNTHHTIAHFVRETGRIQAGQSDRYPLLNRELVLHDNLGDPNKFKDRQPGTGKTMKEEYEDCGYEPINVKISDDVALGHNKVRELLFFDPQQEIRAPNLPRLYVFRGCRNTIQMFKNFAYAQKQGLSGGLSDKLDKTWECPAACIRYFAMSYGGYETGSNEVGGDEDEDDSEYFGFNSSMGNYSERCL